MNGENGAVYFPYGGLPYTLDRVITLVDRRSFVEPDVDRSLVALFGSETRVRTLAVLASAFRPMTAYRVGKVGSIPMPKVYREIDRLAESRLVGREGDGWVLLDPDVRTLFRKRVPIHWAGDWLAERARRLPKQRALFELLRRTAHARPPANWEPREPERFSRPSSKDKALRDLGLRASVHAT